MKFHYSSHPNGMKLSAIVCLVSLPWLPRQINQIVSFRVKLRGASIRKSVFVYSSFMLLSWTWVKVLHIDLHMLNTCSLSQNHYSKQKQIPTCWYLSLWIITNTSGSMFKIHQNVINTVNIDLMHFRSFYFCIQTHTHIHNHKIASDKNCFLYPT